MKIINNMPKKTKDKIQEELKSLGEEIRETRVKQGYTQLYIERLAGVSHATIARMENGDVSSLHAIGAVAEALGFQIKIVTTQTRQAVRASKAKEARTKQLAQAKTDYTKMAYEIVKIVKNNYDLSKREKAIIDIAVHITSRSIFYTQSSLPSYYIEYSPQQRCVGFYSNRHKLLATVSLDNSKVRITSRNSSTGDRKEENKVSRFREIIKNIKEQEDY